MSTNTSNLSTHSIHEIHTQPVTSPSAKTAKPEEKKSRTLLNILPKLPSSDSLSNSPGPASPGNFTLTMWPFYSSVALAGVASHIEKPDVITDRVSPKHNPFIHA